MILLSFFSRTNIFCFTALWIIAVIGMFLLPYDAQVPIVWSPFAGKPIVFAPGWLSVLVLPLLALFLTTILGVSGLMYSKKDFESGRHVFHVSVNGFLCMMLVLECTLIFIGRGGDIYYPKVAALLAGGLLVVIGNILPKSQPSRLIGVALQRAVHDPANWRITHRWTGRFMVFTGLVLIVLALTVLDGPGLFMGVFTAFTVPMIAGITLSYFASRNKN